MMTPEEIFAEVQNIFEESFDIPKEKITPQTQLFEDLDLDSIDAIDLVVHLEKKTGRKLAMESLVNLKTIQNVVDAVESLLAESE